MCNIFMGVVILPLSLVGTLLSVEGHASEPLSIEVGMTVQEVVKILGPPDRIAILDGKHLRNIPDVSALSNHPDARFVYIYDERNIRVWFRHGMVTGANEGGGALLNPAEPPDTR